MIWNVLSQVCWLLVCIGAWSLQSKVPYWKALDWGCLDVRCVCKAPSTRGEQVASCMEWSQCFIIASCAGMCRPHRGPMMSR